MTQRASTTTLEPWDEAWAAFLRDGKGVTTRKNYRSYAKAIDEFRREHGITHPDEFTDALEGEFLERWGGSGTRWTYQKALRAFFNWGIRNGWRHNAALAKRIVRTELDEPIKIADHALLTRAMGQASPRDRALLAFIYYTGARAGEARNARIDYWHRSEHTMILEMPKTQHRREIPVPENGAREINRYIDRVRPATRQPWLFLTTTRRDGDYRQLSESALASALRRLRDELDLPTGDFSAQLLRRGRATEWAKATRDTHHLMRLGGWRDPRSLRRYLYQSLDVVPMDLVDKVRAR